MTAPAPSGGSSPLKIGGIALIGVAAAAAVVGLVSLATGSGGGGGTQASSATAPATPGPSGEAAAPTGPTAGEAVPVPSFTPTPAPTVAPTGEAGAAFGSDGSTGGSGGGGVVAAPKEPLLVYNNSTIQGLAASAASDFRSAGWTVKATENYQGLIPTSTVYYGPGEQASAERLAAAFGLRVLPRSSIDIPNSGSGLLVVVTRDYQGRNR